jgi:hypothetical protein
MNTVSKSLFSCLLAVGLLLVGTTGCGPSGPNVVPVSGKVLIDGKPLTYGYVRFLPSGGRASDAEIKSDGTFELRYSGDQKGALVGEHRVEIAASQTLSPTKVKWHAPKKYASIGTSGLTYKVEGPKDDVVLEIKWEGREKGPYEETFAEKTY